MSLETKLVVRIVFNFFLERNIKPSLKLTSEATKIPYSTVSRIVNARKDCLPKTVKKSKKVADSFSDVELKEMRTIIYNMYDKNEVPTLEGIKKEFNKRGFPFPYCLATLRLILHKMSFTYKTINKKLTIIESERLKRHRTEFIVKIRQYRQENRPIIYLNETWYDTHDILKKDGLMNLESVN